MPKQSETAPLTCRWRRRDRKSPTTRRRRDKKWAMDGRQRQIPGSWQDHRGLRPSLHLHHEQQKECDAEGQAVQSGPVLRPGQ